MAVSACASGAEPGTDQSAGPSGKIKVALIGNQRFGDQGPMDDMAAGLKKCATDFGFETKTFESIETAAHENDVRAVAQSGYDLIFTTFPDMSPATQSVAADFPQTKFGAVYQFINVNGGHVANVWDTEYRGDSTYYIAGAAAATLTVSGKIGFVAGDQDPTITAAVNGMIQGARSVNPNIAVSTAVAGSYEDPAKGKDIAKAMTSRGVDVIVTAAAKTQLGVIDGAIEANALVIGDVGDYSDRAPKNFVSYVGSSFGQNVYLGCENFKNGKFAGGEHSFIDLTNGGYSFPTDPVTKWGKASGRDADAAKLVTLAEKITADVKSGSLKVQHDTTWPKS
ncbi:BMP family ABC transporter substrate-binding protein [Dactylosporangium sp. NPDC051485]|uniref:BMP family ABC transporter substrate-binding protein n=1 Tax=Dactylosporangium sp. NPDC051485 TaxID=3154846 RepID=UPI00341C34C8